MHFLTLYSQWKHSHRHNTQPHWHHIMHFSSAQCLYTTLHCTYTHYSTENRLKTIVRRRIFMNYTCVDRLYMCYAMYWIYPDSAECIELPERKWRCYGLSNFIQMEVCVLVCRRTSYQLLKNKINIFYTFWFGIIWKPEYNMHISHTI